MKKEYYSESLDEILKKHINIATYGSSSVLLRDIFQRRAYEFGFSDKHMENEIKNFRKNCKFVNFMSNQSFESKNVGGSFSYDIKNIKINLESISFQDKPTVGEDVYEVLTHEVYHAISARRDKTTGLTYKDEFGYNQGVALNEVFTEVAANRASKNITTENELKTGGYSQITPTFQMLSLSLGISQKELLRAGIQNREELMKCISSKFQTNEQFENAKDMLEKIEINLNGIYNYIYGDYPRTDLREQVFKGNCQSLSDNFRELAAYQMSIDPTITPEEKSYRLERMEEVQKKMDYELLGIREQSVSNIDSETRQEKFEQEFDGGRRWDNNQITEKAEKIFNFHKITNPFIALDKFMKKLKIPQNRLLGKGKSEEKIEENDNSIHNGYKETEFDRKYRVRPEDLRPMEEVKAETARKMELKRLRESQMQESGEEHQIGSHFNMSREINL